MKPIDWTAAEREAVEQALTTPEIPGLTDYGMVPVRIDSAAFTRAALDALAPFVAERERQAAARVLEEAATAMESHLSVFGDDFPREVEGIRAAIRALRESSNALAAVEREDQP